MVHAEGRVGAKFKPSRRHAAAHQRIAKVVTPPSLAGSHCDDDVALCDDDVALSNDDVAWERRATATGGGRLDDESSRRGRRQELGPVLY
jgi:hypothetical protein